MSARATRPVAALLAALAVLATACSGGDGGEVSWRGVNVALPQGWIVFEEGPQYLSVADGAAGEEAGDPGDREAAAFFSHEPGTLPDDWRQFVVDVEGELEVDRDIEIDGLPATQLVFRHASNGVPIREMIVLVPSRKIVILMQPLVAKGQEDGPQQFDAHLAEFEALLSGITFGAPAGAMSG